MARALLQLDGLLARAKFCRAKFGVLPQRGELARLELGGLGVAE